MRKNQNTLNHILGGGDKIAYFTTDELPEICRRENALVFAAVFWNMLNRQRRELYERMKEKGLEFANVISPTAVIRGRIEGGNCWINDYVVIQSDAVVKADTFIMDGAFIGNMAVIGEHSFIGAHSVVGGSSVLTEQCFTGLNSVIFDGVKLGKRCAAGACSAVKRDMPDNTICKVISDNFICATYSSDVIESKLLVTSERKRLFGRNM